MDHLRAYVKRAEVMVGLNLNSSAHFGNAVLLSRITRASGPKAVISKDELEVFRGTDGPAFCDELAFRLIEVDPPDDH